ncbi:MAG: O-antigen ligase family protein [bacterium]|nr:O-antigen ligase family protein [bacterium]
MPAIRAMWQKLLSNFPKYSFYIFLASIPFGARVLVYQFTTGFDEYETIFVYLSDILMVLFLVVAAQHSNILQNVRMWAGENKALGVFLFFVFLSVFWALSREIALYNFVRLVLLATTALVTAKLLYAGGGSFSEGKTRIVKFEGILAVLAASSVVQSLVGIIQFIKQEGLGLARLGEPLIGPNVGGAAKIIAEGGKILRAYGTLPHPNVLAAFLVIGLLAIYYFWLCRPSELAPLEAAPALARPKGLRGGLPLTGWNTLVSDVFFGVGIFIIILGLTLAFSRAAWIVADLATLAVLLHAFISRKNWIQAVRLTILLAAITVILFSGFKNFILPRAQISPNEPAVTQRIGYNDIARGLIKDNLLGVGVGNQVLYSVKNNIYQQAGMNQAWQWQPIHNIYLLMASEIGILGLIAFLLFTGKLLISVAPVVSRQSSVVPFIMLCSLLALGLFDHFLWTLQPGRLMLWLTIGLVMGLNITSKRS